MKTSRWRLGGVVSFCLVATAAWVLAQSAPTAKEQTIPVITFEPKGLGGTYWSWQRGEKYPPLPYNPFPELPVQTLDEKNRIFLIDDRTVDYVALQAYVVYETSAGLNGLICSHWFPGLFLERFWHYQHICSPKQLPERL
jgi:hypothetical protein